MKLYRRSPSPLGTKPNEFWTDARKYTSYIQPVGTSWSATISPAARIKTFGSSPSAAILERLKHSGIDIAVFPIWDWDGSEYVVLNPAALVSIRRLSKP